MAHYLDPQNHLIFWSVFSKHSNLLINFLNAVMPLSVPIEEVEYIPREQLPENPLKRESIVNVRCKNS